MSFDPGNDTIGLRKKWYKASKTRYSYDEAYISRGLRLAPPPHEAVQWYWWNLEARGRNRNEK